MLSGGVDPRLAGMCSQQRADQHGASAHLPLFGAARNGSWNRDCIDAVVPVPVPVQTTLINFGTLVLFFYFRPLL